MALPDVTEIIQDGGLGIVPQTSDNVSAKLGVSSLGTPNTLYSFTDPATVQTTLGVGKLVEATIHQLTVAGGPVYAMPINSSIAGVASSVTHSVGTQTSIPTLSGTPVDIYNAQAIITAAAPSLAAATAAFKYSLDGGITFSVPIAVPTSGIYVIPGTGLTATFGAGTFVVGDTFTFTSTAPGFSSTDLNNGLIALMADPRTWGHVHIVGTASTVAGAVTLASTLDTQLASAANNFRYAYGIIEVPEDTDANIITGFAAFQSVRVALAAGTENLVSSVSGRVFKRSSAWSVSARAQKVAVAEDLSRVATGSLNGIVSLNRDENATPGLDAAGFTTLRTIIGLNGYYITNGKIFAGTISDFQYIHNRRVMDKACAIARVAMLKYLNSSVRVDPVTGFIDERDALRIETNVGGQLKAALTATGQVSAVSFIVTRAWNIISTSQFKVKVRITPLGYAKFIEVDIGYRNPALEPKAA